MILYFLKIWLLQIEVNLQYEFAFCIPNVKIFIPGACGLIWRESIWCEEFEMPLPECEWISQSSV